MTVEVPGHIDVIGQAMKFPLSLHNSQSPALSFCRIPYLNPPPHPPEDISKGKNPESRMPAILVPTLPQTHLLVFLLLYGNE